MDFIDADWYYKAPSLRLSFRSRLQVVVPARALRHCEYSTTSGLATGRWTVEETFETSPEHDAEVLEDD